MIKCGKGFLPECKYYTSAGCISPFNCPYKWEEASINSATTTPYATSIEHLDNTEIVKRYINQIKQEQIMQEPTNYDEATLKMYIEYLKAENVELRARLEKAVELPRVECIMTREWLNRERYGDIKLEWCVLYKKGGWLAVEPCLSKEDAEARLKELKEYNND